jgi:hypothetical protein
MGESGGVQFRVKFRVKFRVPGSGFKVQGSGSGVQGSGFRFGVPPIFHFF